MVGRIRRALHTNEPQREAVIFLTVMSLIACVSRDDFAPWWLWVFCLVFWPIMAFVVNLIHPIPRG